MTTTDPTSTPDAAPPPPTPRIHHKRRDDGATVIWTDPHGYVKGSFGIGVLGPAVLLIALVIPWRVYNAGGTLSPLILTWCGVLAVAGFVLTVLAAEMGYTRHRLICKADELTIIRRTRFRRKKLTLPRAEIIGLEMTEAGFTARNSPVYCLQINRKNAPPVKLLTARADSEIMWAIQTLGPVLDGADAEPHDGIRL